MLTRTVIAASAGLAVAIPVGPALAKDNRAEVRTSGQCTAGAAWKLKVKEEDAGVEVEFEVDSNVSGQAWAYTLTGPSGVISTGTRTTAGPSGSFSVEVATSGAVTDAFKGMATYNGQTCDTTVSSPAPNPNPSPSQSDDNPSSDDSPGSDDKGGENRGSDDTPGTDDNPGSTVDGSCTDDSVAKLRVKGRKATLYVDADVRGERWNYEIRRDGKLVKQGTARTKGSKASFKVKAKSRATGAFTASANRVGSDDSCEIGS
jgi:hypothetical protein